jgi:hypothetical protein
MWVPSAALSHIKELIDLANTQVSHIIYRGIE